MIYLMIISFFSYCDYKPVLKNQTSASNSKELHALLGNDIKRLKEKLIKKERLLAKLKRENTK